MIILIVVTMPMPDRKTRLHWLKKLWKLKYAFTLLLTPLFLMPIPFLYKSVVIIYFLDNIDKEAMLFNSNLKFLFAIYLSSL